MDREKKSALPMISGSVPPRSTLDNCLLLLAPGANQCLSVNLTDRNCGEACPVGVCTANQKKGGLLAIRASNIQDMAGLLGDIIFRMP